MVTNADNLFKKHSKKFYSADVQICLEQRAPFNFQAAKVITSKVKIEAMTEKRSHPALSQDGPRRGAGSLELPVANALGCKTRSF